MSQPTVHSKASRNSIIAGYIRVMDMLAVVTAVLAAILLALGVLVVVQMVFTRYALGESTIWQTEFTTYAITAAMLLATPYVLKTGGHVAVTVLPDALHGLPKLIMRLAASLVGLSFCLALAYGSWYYVYEAYTMAWTTGTVWNPPLWPAVLPMAVGASLLSLQYVAEILRGEA